MDYAVLKAEIALPVYAGLTNDQIAAALNAPVASYRDVAAAEVRETLIECRSGDAWASILRCSRGDVSHPAWAAAKQIDDGQRDPPHIFPLSRPVTRASYSLQVAKLVESGVLTLDERELLAALCRTITTRAEQLGLGQVEPAHVQTARIY
jgi:hypothetical protein